MGQFNTHIHFMASGNNLEADVPYLKKITEAIYKNHAVVTRDWIDPVHLRKKRRTSEVEKLDWETIVNEHIDAIKRSDLVIIEASLLEFNQGLQVYIAAQYKKPTLVLTRHTPKGFFSGISNKYISLKQYSNDKEIDSIVSEFIKQHAIPEKDLRFNLILSRRIYKYLRDKSYETGKNKSEIIRELLEDRVRR